MARPAVISCIPSFDDSPPETHEKTLFHSFSLLAALATAFSVILVFTVLFSAQSQRAHLEEYSQKYVEGLAKSYFDGLNTMMLTGTIGNRDMLRDKAISV